LATENAKTAGGTAPASVCIPEPPIYPKRWFCGAILTNGETIKQDAETPDRFLELLPRAVVAWIDYRTADFNKDAPFVSAQLGFSTLLLSALTCEPRLTYEDFDSEMGLRLPSVRVHDFDVVSHPLLMLLRKNFVVTIHSVDVDHRFARLRRYSDTVLRKIPLEAAAEDKLTMLMMRIVEENNDSNFQRLREIEERGDKLNDDLMNAATPRERLAREIYTMKHALILYMNSLWETVDVLHALRDGDAELISNDPRLLQRISVQADDVARQIALAEHMSSVLASGLEVMQSIYNNQLQVLNNRLALIVAYLTILGTAILVPNTLASVFSSSALNLGPQDAWWYVTMLVVATIVSTFLAFWWVRKRGWVPRRADS
jgi:magnesium transporter